MKIEKIKEILKYTSPKPIGVNGYFSVMIPLIEYKNNLHLLYEKRSKNITQPGEVSFPGGRMEKNESTKKTAIRETMEELLIEKNDIMYISEGDFLLNRALSIIYSHICIIKKPFDEIIPSKDEVEKIFTVPLDYLLNTEPKKYPLKVKILKSEDFPYNLIPGGENYKFERRAEDILFYEYNGEIIWGFTAKLTYNFIKKLKNNI